jgi:hypothetical protein
MDEYVKAQLLGNAVEAGLMETELNERGIPHIIISFHDSAYDGLFQAQKGWGVIKAPEEFKAEIKAIYEDVSSRRAELLEDMPQDLDDEMDEEPR